MQTRSTQVLVNSAVGSWLAGGTVTATLRLRVVDLPELSVTVRVTG